MFVLTIAEIVVWVTVVAFILTQVALPLTNGTILFPLFKSKKSRLEAEVRRMQDEIEERAAQEFLDELKRQTKETRRDENV